MHRALIMMVLGWLTAGCGSTEDADGAHTSSRTHAAREREDAGGEADGGETEDAGAAMARVIDLSDVERHPERHDFRDFRPNVRKLILAGAAESQHIAVLWYTTKDGGVGLHYHAKTESVFVIDGTQTDAKGDYPTGTLYFNPPGSGHQITNSSGFFLLAYAAPPDFMNTAAIGDYSPVRIDTTDPELTNQPGFEPKGDGARVLTPPLAEAGGMRAELIALEGGGRYAFSGNYLLVLRGRCAIDGATRGVHELVVGDANAPALHTLAANGGGCLCLGVSF
jgi:hypothetical protein